MNPVPTPESILAPRRAELIEEAAIYASTISQELRLCYCGGTYHFSISPSELRAKLLSRPVVWDEFKRLFAEAGWEVEVKHDLYSGGLQFTPMHSTSG